MGVITGYTSGCTLPPPQLCPLTSKGWESPYLGLIQSLRREKSDPEMTKLFDQLKSSDELTVKRAEETINFLQNEEQTRFQTILSCSLPLQPIDVAALEQIVLEDFDSKHPLLQQRAFHACEYLVSHRYAVGYAAAAVVASEKMKSNEKKVQKEGIIYFTLFLQMHHPIMPQDDFKLALSIVKNFYIQGDLKFQGRFLYPNFILSRFIEALINNCETKDVAQLKELIDELCFSNKLLIAFQGFAICEELIRQLYKHETLLYIPLEIAASLCSSEDFDKRAAGFKFFELILEQKLEFPIDPLLEALEVEAKSGKPEEVILKILEKLADHPFSTLVDVEGTDQNNLRLLSILDNLSSGLPHLIKEISKLELIVSKRLKQAQERD